MAIVKGALTKLYVDVDGDDEYRLVGCLRSMTPPGVSRGVNTEPPCLDENAVSTQDTDDATYTELQAVLDHDIDGAVDQELEAAIIADTQCKWVIEYPTNPLIYASFEGKLTSYSGQSIERTATIRKGLSVLPRTAITYGAVAPTLEA